MEVLGTTMAQNLLAHASYIQVEIIQERSSLSLILSYLKPLLNHHHPLQMNYPRHQTNGLYSNICGSTNYTIPVQTLAIWIIIYTKLQVQKITTVVLTSLTNLMATTISCRLQLAVELHV